MPLQREREKITGILSDWQGDTRLWLHLHGMDGDAQTMLLDLLLKKNLARTPLFFRYDFGTFPFKSWFHVKKLLYHVLQSHEVAFKAFLSQFPLKMEKLILRSLKADTEIGEGFTTGDSWEYNLLYQFMAYLGQRHKLVLALENFFAVENDQLDMLKKMLVYSKDLPLCVISTGAEASAGMVRKVKPHLLEIGKRSVRETEKLAGAHLNANAINARLITNQLYIKSGGQIRKIKFMLETFYRPMLTEGGDLLSNLDMQRSRVSASENVIFSELTEAMPEGLLDILSFLSRLEDPLPKTLFLHVIKIYHFNKRDYNAWVTRGYIDEKCCQNEDYVIISWQPWREFLRKNTSVERSRVILELLKKKIGRQDLQLPLGLSSHFLDVGDFSTALKFAFLEAKSFEQFGENHRALERYAFLKRNLLRFPQANLPKNEVLKGMGMLQKKLGLYENAFESFRELREGLARDQREAWVTTSLEMADTLFQMDALSEALYHIKEIKIKDAISFYAYTFSNILMGELEQNFGHPKYALRYYEKALSILPKVTDEKLIFRLFSILKNIYADGKESEKYIAALAQIDRNLAEGARLKPVVQLELIKCHIGQHDYDAALPHATALFRNAHSLLSPRMAARIRLYLAEIYGYYGKWYLSRSHLRSIYKTQILISNLRVQVRVMVDLGIVEKELGHYGAALNLLEQALELCKRYRLVRQQYHIKIHIGHIYLLVHGFMRASDHLLETLRWAKENQDESLLISANLFLASFAMQQGRMDSAKEYLQQAKQTVSLLNNPLDRLNLLYYQIIFYLKTEEIEKAARDAKSLAAEAQSITKFENLSLWLSGKVALAEGEENVAEKNLAEALQRSQKYRLPYLEFQVLRDLTKLAKQQNNPVLFDKYARHAQAAFQNLLSSIGDEIMQRQIEESQEYEAFLKLGS